MSTIRFEIRSDKKDKDGLYPIRVVYQVSSQRRYFPTKEKIRKENWDIDNQVAVYLDRKTAKKLLPQVDFDLLPTSKDIRLVNGTLAGIRRDISDIETKFEVNHIVYSPEMVIEALKDASTPTTKREAPNNEIFKFIENYVDDHKATREPGSLAVYKALKRHLESFQNDKRIKITFQNIDYAFFQQFQIYLLEVRGLGNTTVAKQLSTIKTFLNYARMQGITVPDGYKDFKIKRETLEVIALSNEEFEGLFNLDLAENKKYAQVRDVFCFACATGLRYSDLDQLKREHIKRDEIRLIVKKTKEPLTVPLNPYSASILEKYMGKAKPLPVISNQKMNAYLKGWTEKDRNGKPIEHQGICQLAGIDEEIEIVRFRGTKRETATFPKYKLIGVHTGRKTFATLSLEKGMSAEEVMTITGHRDYKSFKRYVKVTETRKKVVMRNAWGEIKKSNLKVV